MASHVKDYIGRLVLATHPETPGAPEIAKKYIRFGASPRAAQAIILAAKVLALREGRYNVSFADVRAVLALAEIAPVALRYGATDYKVFRSREPSTKAQSCWQSAWLQTSAARLTNWRLASLALDHVEWNGRPATSGGTP